MRTDFVKINGHSTQKKRRLYIEGTIKNTPLGHPTHVMASGIQNFGGGDGDPLVCQRAAMFNISTQNSSKSMRLSDRATFLNRRFACSSFCGTP